MSAPGGTDQDGARRGGTGQGSARGSAGRTVVLGGLTAAAPLAIDTYLPALPAITEDLQTTASLVALSLTACVLGLALGQLVAGPLSDVLGRRRPLLVGTVGFAVLSVACALAPDVWSLVALRFGQGLFGAVGIVLARAVVRDLYSGPAAARAFATLMLVSGVAPIVAPVIGGQLLRVTSWRGTFVFLAVLGLVLAIGVLTAVPESHPPERRTTGGPRATLRSFRVLLADPRILACVLAAGFGFSALFSYVSGSTFVLQGLHGLSPQQFSGVFAINSVGIVAAAQVSGRLVAAERVAPVPMVRVGLLVILAGSATTLAVASSPTGPVPLLVGFFVMMVGIGTTMPSLTTLTMADHPEHAGSASALLGTSQFLVGGLAAPLVGIGGGTTAVPLGIVMTVSAAAALLAFTLLWRRADRQAVAVEHGASPGG